MKLGLILVSLLLTATPAFSYSLHYISKTSIDTSKYNPPVENSREDLADLDAVLKRTQRTTPAECAKARFQLNPNLQRIFGNILKEKIGLSPQVVSEIENTLIGPTTADVDYFVHVIKQRTKRLRPFMRNPQIQAWQEKCLPSHPSMSYVSGHAAIARMQALVLTDLYPRFREVWDNGARDAAEYRVLGGVHHYTDVRDGAQLANEVFAIIKQTPSYQADLAALKKNLRIR